MKEALVLGAAAALVLTACGSVGEPFSYGDDPELDALHDGCAAGDLPTCRELRATAAQQSTEDSDYYTFAVRRIETLGRQVPLSYGSDARWDMLYDQCAEDGDSLACEDLLMAPQGSEYQKFAQEQIDAANERYDAENGGQTDDPLAETTSVPPGYEDVFPVTVEYEVDGWTYARTFYGGPSITTAEKSIETSPPGLARLLLEWDGAPPADSGEISLDEGRNAPGSGLEVVWNTWVDASVRGDLGDNINPYGCGYSRVGSYRPGQEGEPQGWTCQPFEGDPLIDSQNEGPEEVVDVAVQDFKKIDAMIVGVTWTTTLEPGTAPSVNCLAKITKDGSVEVYPYEGRWTSGETACTAAYQGEIKN